MVKSCIQMLPISFKWLRFSLKWLESLWNASNIAFESLSNVWNLHSNASNLIRMVQIRFRTVRIPLECSNSHSNDSNPCFEFAFEWLESSSYGSNMHSNASNHIRMAGICIRIVRICFEWFEFALECFESRSNGSNLL